MTRPRRRLLFLLIATLVIVPAVSWFVWREVTKPESVRAYERLKLGMTRDEVTEAVGVPPGEYEQPVPPGTNRIAKGIIRESGLPSSRLLDVWNKALPPGPGNVTVEDWYWDDHWLWVAFDHRDTAVGYYLHEVDRPPSLFDRVRKCVGW